MDFQYNEGLFTPNDFRIYALLCKSTTIGIDEIVRRLNLDPSAIKKSLAKLENLGWIKEKDGSYSLDLLTVFNNAIENLSTKHHHLREQDYEFINQTASSMQESISAANGHITASNENLIKEVKNLTNKLSVDIDDTLAKYEHNRLRNFGIFRINLDNFMHSIKEDLIRELRTQLGFTIDGEFKYTESVVVPEMPSALSIAENANSARELIRRGFLQLKNQLKSNFDIYNQEYRHSMLNHISELEELSNTEKNEIVQSLDTEHKLIMSLLDKAFHEFQSAKTVSIFQFREAQKKLQNYFDAQTQYLTSKVKESTYQLLSQFVKGINDTITTLGTYSSKTIPELISSKTDKTSEKINKMALIYDNTLSDFIAKSDSMLNTMLSITEDYENNFNSVLKAAKPVKKYYEEIKGLAYKLLKEETLNENMKHDVQQLILTVEQLEEELEGLKHTFNSFQNNAQKNINNAKKQLKLLGHDASHLGTLEIEMRNILMMREKKQSEILYQQLRFAFETVITNLSQQLLENQRTFDETIKHSLEDFVKTLEVYVSEHESEISEQYNDEMQSLEENFITIASSFEERTNELNRQIEDLKSKISSSLDVAIGKMKVKLEKILNNHELFQANMHTEAKEIYETLETSLLARINTLENNLGSEYEELLKYYEQTRETTIGTVKTLLDDLTLLLNKKIEVIWTSVLRELNSLQEKTGPKRTNQTVNNMVVEASTKIVGEIENQIKAIEIALQMVADSFKLSFDELGKKSKESAMLYQNDLSQLHGLIQSIIKESENFNTH